jgi:DNA primase
MSTQDWNRVVRSKGRKGRSASNAISIEVIVSHYGGEVRQGRAASVKCCIHDDSRRSAVINTYDNLYFCHTCGKGGSAIDVIMEKEGLGYKDAVSRADEIIVGSGGEVQSKPRRGNRSVSRRTWYI